MSFRYFMIAGAGMVVTSLAGKGFIKFYRAMKMTENVAKTAGGSNLLGKYYKGGFLAKMTTREASLILGIRESADKERIMTHHRKMMFLNHPDNGGSTYLATKVNEAKEVLLKGS